MQARNFYAPSLSLEVKADYLLGIEDEFGEKLV